MSRDRRITVPTKCLEADPTSRTVRLAGRYISLAEVERIVGLDHGYVSYILQGKRVPTLKYLTKIADALGMYTVDGDEDINSLMKAIQERKDDLDASFKKRIAS